MRNRMTPAKWMKAKGYRPMGNPRTAKRAGDLVLTRKGPVTIEVDQPAG